MIKKLMLLVCMLLLIGMANAQYPYYDGYYGLSNAYWSAQLYQGPLPWGSGGYTYYNIYSPGGYWAGTSSYNYQSDRWDYYTGNRQVTGYSYNNPYWW